VTFYQLFHEERLSMSRIDSFYSQVLQFFDTGLCCYRVVHNGIETGGYMYPFTLLWWSFGIIPIWNFVFAVLVSILHSYYQFSKSLTQLQKKAASIFLFHPDGHCGMKSIVDFVYYLSSRLLILVVIGTVCWLIGIKYFPQEFSQIGIVGLISIIDVFSLVILLVPLMTLRKIVKKKKEQERKIIMERIRKKEENITLEKDTETSKDFEDLRNLFLILERVDSVNEWLIGKRIKISFSIESIFGFNPLMFELLRRSF
jgi:hypothetical protein